jgi:hypothetical protein
MMSKKRILFLIISLVFIFQIQNLSSYPFDIYSQNNSLDGQELIVTIPSSSNQSITIILKDESSIIFSNCTFLVPNMEESGLCTDISAKFLKKYNGSSQYSIILSPPFSGINSKYESILILKSENFSLSSNEIIFNFPTKGIKKEKIQSAIKQFSVESFKEDYSKGPALTAAVVGISKNTFPTVFVILLVSIILFSSFLIKSIRNKPKDINQRVKSLRK